LINFMWFAIGLASLLLALAACLALLRAARTLAAMEDLLLTVNEEMRETLPEVRGSLGNVNDITAGVNVALKTAGSGAARLSVQAGEVADDAKRELRAGWYGVRVGFRSLLGGTDHGK
jgi:hypothetical protein